MWNSLFVAIVTDGCVGVVVHHLVLRSQRCRSRSLCGRGRLLLLPLPHTQDNDIISHLVFCLIAFSQFSQFLVVSD